MNIKGFLRIIIILIFPVFAFSQEQVEKDNSRIEWERYYDGFRKDAANKIIEDFSGNLVMVGNTDGRKKKKQDLLFWKVSPNGRDRIRNIIGTTEEEGANAIASTFDGGYVIAGYTDTRNKNVYTGKDPLLLRVDELGEPVWWYEIEGSEEDDAFYDVCQMPDGSIVAVGNLGSAVYVVKISPNGKQIRKTFGGYNSIGRAVTQNSNNELVVTGNWGNQDNPVLFATKLVFRNEDIDKVWQKTPRTAAMRMNKGLDIIHLMEGGYAIVGTGLDKSNEEKLGLVILNEKGRGAKIKSFGGVHEEGGNSLVQTSDGNLLLAGYSNSHQRGARRNKAWLQLVNYEGEELWGEDGEFLGGKQEDELLDVVQTSDGNLFAVGQTSSESLGNQDGWLVKISENLNPEEVLPTQLSVSKVRFVDENQNDTLNARERSFLHFMIKNEGLTTAHNIHATTSVTGKMGGLDVAEKIIIGRLSPGDSIFASVPIVAKSYLGNGKSNIHVFLKAANSLTGLNSFSYTILSKKEPLPELKITDYKFLTINQKGNPNRRERIRLEIELTNEGERTAREVEFKFIYPQKIEAINTREFALGDMKPNESQKLQFDFYAASYYELDSIKIYCRAREKAYRRFFNEHFIIKLKEFNQDVGPASKLKNEPKYPYEYEPMKSGGGPNMDLYFENWDKPKIEWIAPFVADEQNMLNQYIYKDIDIKLKVTSDKSLDSTDFQMIINSKNVVGQPYFDPKNIQITVSETEDGLLEYLYQNKINLEKGDNFLALGIDGATSKSVKVHYVPPQGNIHVIAFGIPHEDLNYTQNDANDFSESFDNQKNKLFEEVRVLTYATEDSTTKRRLSFAVQDIQNDFFFEKIGIHDVVTLYFSSHGFTYRDSSFFLAASDYNDHYPQQTSLDFQREVLEILDKVECKKVIFIDACSSGAESLAKLAADRNDYQFVVSCSADEVSYEDSLWQNGAFTEALMEVFKAVEPSMEKRIEKADSNKDRKLSLEEIFEYVRKRVPELVKSKRPKIKGSQTPYSPQLDDLSLYALYKNINENNNESLDKKPLEVTPKDVEAKLKNQEE
ncbi:MAG: caspase family protein [Bacteroidetes bacterium]|jgi:hypothetical protein|nr:caspase family protein [Bacteroidota bacterium]MDF1864866.1 caspase family protein [Saprospiraceae bacterium]